MTTTREAFARGGVRMQWVACIDGYDKLLTDGDPAAALAAHAGTDWTEALSGLVVECRPQQVGDVNNPFANTGGRCVLHMMPDRDDTFGIDVHRRGAGSWTTLAATIDRNDTALTIKSNTGFAAGPADAHIGVECMRYSGTTSSTMTVTTRGRYTAVGCHASGSGGSRFADHHRVALDQNMIQSNPLVSEQPRRWIGRRVNLYLHVVVDGSGTLNSKVDAELVFPGRITAIGDEQNGYTVLQVRHLLAELGEAVIGGNQFSAIVTEGIYIPAGAKFKLTEHGDGVVVNTATDLTVVASGASGTNQINAGMYSLSEIVQFINAWCGGNRAAGTIDGKYTWASPLETADGLRTVCDFYLDVGSSQNLVTAKFVFPSGVAGMLGWAPTEGVFIGGSTPIVLHGFEATTLRRVSEHIPYRTAVFSKGGPGGALPTFKMFLENERGEFVNQYDTMPGIIKPGLDSTKEWGLFLVDEKLLIQASYDSHNLDYCFITPFGMQSIGDSQEPFYTLGRRADDDSGAVTVRQVFDHEGTFEQLMNILHYNTGTDGYNHGTYDTGVTGFGLGIPGGYLGDAFEQSIANLPRAEATMRIRYDEPTKFSELIGGDLLSRGAFPVWKNGGIVYQQWQSPTAALATFELTEENKYRPANSEENPKSPTLETAEHARPVIKFDFSPDFAFGRDVRFRASLSLVDHVAVDDGGTGTANPMTIKLRNVPSSDDAAALMASTLAKLPMRSRPSKFVTRSIGSDLFFGIAPGDVCLTTDRFARDPLTGLRYNASTDTGGLDERPAVLMVHEFDLGGETAGEGHREPRDFTGNVEVNFFDQNRCVPYGASADIDESVSSGGFSAGYNSGTLTLRCKAHVYSESTEPVDAANFGANYEIVIVEKDPTNPASPTTWTKTIASRSGSDIVLTSALSSPAWDPAKKYRITFAQYSSATALQRDLAFQADDADELVQDVEVPYLWSASQSETPWTYNTTEPTELTPDLSNGDGKSHDVGHERAIGVGVNNLIDHKTAHHAMFMWTEVETGEGGGGGLSEWAPKFFGRIYLGQDRLTSAVFRYLTISPWMWLDNTVPGMPSTGRVRVTISRDPPTDEIGTTSTSGITDPNGRSAWFSGPHSSALFTTTSTTEAAAPPQTLEISVKDLQWGWAYITVEIYAAFCRGLIEGREGERVLVL